MVKALSSSLEVLVLNNWFQESWPFHREVLDEILRWKTRRLPKLRRIEIPSPSVPDEHPDSWDELDYCCIWKEFKNVGVYFDEK